MVIFREFFRLTLSSFAVISSLLVPSHARAASAEIVFVEAVPKNESSVNYRIMHMSTDGKKKLVTSLPDPVELIRCNDAAIAYVDQNGRIWSQQLAGGAPAIVASTQYLSEEDAVGKTLLRLEERRFYAVSNSAPGSLKASNQFFQILAFDFDGKKEVVASGKGVAYAMHGISEKLIEVVSSNGLYQVDASSMKIVRIIPVDSGDLPYLVMIRGGYGIFSQDNGKIFQVKKGVFGEAVLHYSVESGFGVAQDFDVKRKSVLISVVSPGFGGDRLVEVIESGARREVHRGAAIGSACYMH